MAAITFPPSGLPQRHAPRLLRPAGPKAAPRVAPSVYRRRRCTAAAVLLGVLLAGSWALGALGGGPLTASEARPSRAAPAAPSVNLAVAPVARTTYVVAAGDTLWSIARRFQPTGDVRPLVDALASGRGGRPLRAGEAISLPHAASRPQGVPTSR